MAQKNRPPEISEIRYRLSDGREVCVGPWLSAKRTKDASVVDTTPQAPAYAYTASAEPYISSPTSPAPSLPSRAGALEYVPEESEPSHFERAAGELEQAVEILTPIHRGLSSITTVGTYTAIGLITGAGFGALAYNLMDNPRSVSASLLVGGICTITGVVAGWYKAHQLQR